MFRFQSRSGIAHESLYRGQTNVHTRRKMLIFFPFFSSSSRVNLRLIRLVKARLIHSTESARFLICNIINLLSLVVVIVFLLLSARARTGDDCLV